MEAIKLISRDVTDDSGRFLNPNRCADTYTTAERGVVEAIVLPVGGNCNPRLIEISENLHRQELSALERDEQLAEWIRLTETSDDKPRQSDAVSKKGGRGRKGGVAEASRQLGVSEPDARRAVQVAKLSDEAKHTARDLGLDDNRSALLDAAKATEPSDQVEALTRRATRKSAPLAASENPLTLAWPLPSEERAAQEEHLRRIEERIGKIVDLISENLNPRISHEVFRLIKAVYDDRGEDYRGRQLIHGLLRTLNSTPPADDGIPPELRRGH